MRKHSALLLVLLLSILPFVSGQETSYYQTSFLSYLGGEGDDHITGIALDSQGNIIIVGYTYSQEFSFAPEVSAEHYDAFITKMTPSGALLFFKTFGGFGWDFVYDIAIDSEDNIWVSGLTTSGDLPITYDAYQNISAGGFVDALVACFSPDGVLLYASYLGGLGYDAAVGIDVDDNDSVYLCGLTDSANFPLVNPIQNASQGMVDLFIVKIGQNHSELEFSSYLGGAGLESLEFDGHPLAVSTNGMIALTGSTNSIDFLGMDPVTDIEENNTMNSFVCILNGTEDILYSRWILYEANETGTSVCFDEYGTLFGTGVNREMVPILVGESDLIFVERSEIYLFRLNISNYYFRSREVSGFLDEFTNMISMNNDGNIVVSGSTNSINFPRGDIATEFSYGLDAFVSVFNSSSLSTISTVFVGGADNEFSCHALIDASDRIIIAGTTTSIDLEVVNEIQDVKGDYLYGNDGFVGIVVEQSPLTIEPIPPIAMAAIVLPGSAALLMLTLIFNQRRKKRLSHNR
jgi:hypothetical protein